MIEADVLLDDEQRKLSQVVRDFADSVVAPAAYRYDTERRLPMEIIAQMGSGCSGCRSRATSAVRARTTCRCASPSRRSRASTSRSR